MQYGQIAQLEKHFPYCNVLKNQISGSVLMLNLHKRSEHVLHIQKQQISFTNSTDACAASFSNCVIVNFHSQIKKTGFAHPLAKNWPSQH